MSRTKYMPKTKINLCNSHVNLFSICYCFEFVVLQVYFEVKLETRKLHEIQIVINFRRRHNHRQTQPDNWGHTTFSRYDLWGEGGCINSRPIRLKKRVSKFIILTRYAIGRLADRMSSMEFLEIDTSQPRMNAFIVFDGISLWMSAPIGQTVPTFINIYLTINQIWIQNYWTCLNRTKIVICVRA